MEGTSNWQRGDPGMNGEVSSAEWRSQLQPEARQRIVNKIMETLKRHLPISGTEGLGELKKIAVRFEEKIYTAATSQSDYLRKISMKMLTMEQKTQGTVGANQLSTNPTAAGQNPADQANILPPQVRNQGLSLPIPVANQPPPRQQLLSQSLQNNIASAPVSGSAGLSTALSSLTGLTPSSMSSLGQNQNMQVMPGISQNSVNNTPGQGAQANIYANSQRQMQGRHHQQSMISQQPQNQLLYQQQLMKQKIQQSSHVQQPQQQPQQQQQPLLQASQLQSSQQPLTQLSSGLQSNQNSLQHSQSSMIQSVSQSGMQQNQQNSVQQPTSSLHQQHAQSFVRQQPQPSQQSNLHQQNPLVQQPPSITQQSAVLPSQQQQIMNHQSNMSNIQQSQLLGQQNSISDMQPQPQLHQQQHQRLPSQQNGLISMQQSQQVLNQQNISLHQQQQPSSQNNISGLQQQQSLQQQHQPQMLGSQATVSNMQHQHSMHILQHSKAGGQQVQQTSPALLQVHGQQTQAHTSQQQHMSQPQSQHLQQQIGMQQQQQLQQRLQAPSALLQSQIAVEQQKQHFQTQRGVPPEAPSSSVDSTAQTGQSGLDWQEECYQKIKSMRELYSADLQDMSQRIGMKVQQQEALALPARQSDQLETMKKFKALIDRMLQLVHIPKNNIPHGFKEKLPSYEKQIHGLLANRGRRTGPSQPQGQQQLHSGGQNMPMPQPPSQVSQLPQADNHINQMQPTSFTASSTPMHSTAISSMQSGSMPLSTQSGVSTMQQNIMSSLPHGSNLETASALSSMQQGVISSLQNGGLGPLQQSNINATHQNNINSMMQNTVSSLQPNVNSLQANSNMLQHQVKQEQQILQAQQIKRMQQQMAQQKHQILQQQPQLQQQLHQQHKQQPSAQLQGHQIQQLHQMNEMNELKMRPGIKSGLQPHYPAGQRSAYYQQQLKLPPSFPISSPQNLQVPSPQLSQHSSPQIDQQVLSSVPKTGTPLQSVNSPFVVPSPSTPLAPSPLPADHEKQLSSSTSLSNAGNAVPQQSGLMPAQAQSLAVGTPGISASPLLAEFTSVDGNQANSSAAIPGKATATEQPQDRLIKVVQSSSPHVLASSASDIGSVVSMIDRIAGSAPGNGSRAAVGEDLVAMTKCRMQARNFMQQDGGTATKKMKRHTSAMPLNAVSSAGSVHDSMKQSSIDTSELESTATSRVKRQKMEANHALLEEIRYINQQLIDSIVDVTDEDVDSTNATAEGEGTIVKCTYSAVALSPSLKSQFASAKVSPILPLRLLIPAHYPCRSPVLLDKIPVEASKESEDLSIKAKSCFSIALRGLSQPMSLKDMARTWDICARKVISEYAQQSGGGTFSSRYGTWENCVSA